jgi:hypothetical protein
MNNLELTMKLLHVGKNAVALFAATALLGLAQSSYAAITSYSQDFESLDASNEFELGTFGGEGFEVFANIWFGGVGTQLRYSYGPFTAPNGYNGFSDIAGGEGGVEQGSQYLNIYSDYDNTDHGNGLDIDTNVFQQFTIDAVDIGSTWTFSGQYKAPSTNGIATPLSNATAYVYMQTLDPSDGFIRTNYLRVDTTIASDSEWMDFSLEMALTDEQLTGQLFQFGFNTVATGFEASGVYYDNLNFSSAAVPVPAAAWLFGSALIGLVGVSRKRG